MGEGRLCDVVRTDVPIIIISGWSVECHPHDPGAENGAEITARRRDGWQLGSGHAIVDRADSNADEKCCGSLAKHYNIYVWLKPICVTYHVDTFFTKVRILYFASQERCEGRGWLCGPVLQLAGWRPGPSRKLLRNISVMKRRAAAGGGTVLVLPLLFLSSSQLSLLSLSLYQLELEMKI